MRKSFYCIIIILLLLTASACTEKKVSVSNTKVDTNSSKSTVTSQINDKTQDRFYFISEKKSKLIDPSNFCKQFYPNAKNDLKAKDKDFIAKTFGDPLYDLKLIEQTDGKKSEKSIWIYTVSSDSPTDLFIYFVNNKVEDYKINEFNGLDESTVQMWFDGFIR